MCTVSWSGGRGGYTLWFNRDEQHARAEAKSPRIFGAETDVPWLAPIDPVGGGTWLAANARGLTLGLLNFYEKAGLLPSGRQSRGQLVSTLIGKPSIEAVGDALKRMPLGDFAPFHLLALEGAERVARWTWDGGELAFEDRMPETGFLTTSSIDPERVSAARRRVFEATIAAHPGDDAAHEAFHHQYDPVWGAESVAMAREDARTVSLTKVEVGPDEVRMSYASRSRETLRFASAEVLAVARLWS